MFWCLGEHPHPPSHGSKEGSRAGEQGQPWFGKWASWCDGSECRAIDVGAGSSGALCAGRRVGGYGASGLFAGRGCKRVWLGQIEKHGIFLLFRNGLAANDGGVVAGILDGLVVAKDKVSIGLFFVFELRVCGFEIESSFCFLPVELAIEGVQLLGVQVVFA